ncbi:hypothetical protein Sste5346_008770 [Sporothrix stenoceras]|uniref:Amidase domain-containing protein n=1 Tax=Sporothrix stenoceras TaxID=5173 RepID=A0ABR3YMX3_9PEZI
MVYFQRTTKARDAKLYGVAPSGALSSRGLEITGARDATELLAQIHSGAWTAEEVTLAFCKRAITAHQHVNCIVDNDMEAAVERARELDRHFQRTDKNLVGPLHCLPVSIKDLTVVKVLRYTMGYVSWVDNISEEDAVLIETLHISGAVIFVKTTMPQSRMPIDHMWMDVAILNR